MEEAKKQLAHLMVTRRRSLELSQDQLAERMDVSRRTVARLESGRENPNLSTLLKMAEALQIGFTLQVDVEDRTIAIPFVDSPRSN